MKRFLSPFLSFLHCKIVEMSNTPIPQQMYSNQEQFFRNTQPSPAIETKTIDRTCLIMSISIGMLLAGIVLSTTLTLYITKQRKLI